MCFNIFSVFASMRGGCQSLLMGSKMNAKPVELHAKSQLQWDGPILVRIARTSSFTNTNYSLSVLLFHWDSDETLS